MIRRLLILAGCFLLLPLWGCGRQQLTKNPAQRQVLRVGNSGEVPTLDPHLAVDMQQRVILRGLFEGLVTLDAETLEVLPGVAESWEISDDGLVYTFHLRDDARWNNGELLVAQNFVDSLQRALSPELGAPMIDLVAPVRNALAFYKGKISWDDVGIRACANHLLEITLERPTPYFLSLLVNPVWMPILRKNVETFGTFTQRDTPFARPGNLVSNGAYQLEEWRVGDRLILRKNQHFHGVADCFFDEIVFLPIKDHRTEQNAFENGELDITASVSADKLEGLRQCPDSGLWEHESLGCNYFIIQCEQELLQNQHLRRALALAVNRKELCHLHHRHEKFIAGNLVPPGTGGYTYGGEKVNFDPDAAREELRKAGFESGSDVPSITLTVNNHESHRLTAQAVQEMWWRELGIEVTLKSEDWKSFLLTRRTGRYDVARGGWMGDYNDPLTFLELFLSDARNNFPRWKNAQFDEALSRAGETANQAERFQYLQQAEGILLQELPIIPLFFESNAHRVSPKIRGWHSNIMEYYLFQNLFR